MSIKEFLQQRADRRTVRKDNRRIEYWQKRAKETITVGYIDEKAVVLFGSTPIYHVTNETDLKNGTVALCDLKDEVLRLREVFFLAHKEREIGL